MDLAGLDATAQADLIRRGECSALEVVDAAIDRRSRSLDEQFEELLGPLLALGDDIPPLRRIGAQVEGELERFCSETDYLDAAEVMRMVKRGRAKQLWYLYNLARWHREYIA